MRAATVVLVALLALACVGLSSAFRLGVRMTAGAGVGTRVGAGAGAAAEAESDPHRLLGRKLEKLRAATETAKNKAADEAPLPEYEITDDGISEVKSMATDAAPSKTARNSFYTATSASVASVAVGAGSGVSAATEGMVLMALSEHIAPFADATAVTPALLEGLSSPPSSSPKSSDPAMDRKIAAARKKQKKGTLSCKCTFVPLPNKLPPLKPEQKKTPTGDAAEAKRAAALLKKLTASKKTAAAKPAATAAPTATPAPTTATTATPAPTAAPAAPVTATTPAPASTTAATAAAAVSSGTITPLKALLESESQTRATSASMAAAPQFAPMLDTDV